MDTNMYADLTNVSAEGGSSHLGGNIKEGPPLGGKALGNVHDPAWSPNGDAFRRRLTKAHVGSSSGLTLALERSRQVR